MALPFFSPKTYISTVVTYDNFSSISWGDNIYSLVWGGSTLDTAVTRTAWDWKCRLHEKKKKKKERQLLNNYGFMHMLSQRCRFQTLTKHTHLNCHTLHFCSPNCPIIPHEISISLTHQLHNSLHSSKTPKWAQINDVVFQKGNFFFPSNDSHFMHLIKWMIIYIIMEFRNEQNVTAANYTYSNTSSICSPLCPMYTDNISSLCSHQSHSDEWSLNLNVQTIDWKYGCEGEAVSPYQGCQGNSSALTSDGIHVFSQIF